MPWDPQLRNVLPIHIEILSMMDMGVQPEDWTELDSEPTEDPILAAYLAPKLEGFEAQDALLKELYEKGMLGPPKDSEFAVSPLPENSGVVTFDPTIGFNMPR